MPDNINNDYNELAKLIYPSIEASGNVYYGQTRKLAIDELFNINDGGFESSIKTIRRQTDSNEDGFEYISYFCWKFGPLNGRIRIVPCDNDKFIFTFANFPELEKIYNLDDTYITNDSTDPIVGTLFIRYKILLNDNTVEHILNSGTFNSYEKIISLDTDEVKVYITDSCDPTNVDNRDIDDRNIFVKHENDAYYLFVKLCKCADVENPGDALYFTNINDGESTVKLIVNGELQTDYEYYKSYITGWEKYNIGDVITLQNNNDKVYFRGSRSQQGLDNYVQFNLTGKLSAGGNINSLLSPDESVYKNITDYTTFETTNESTFKSLFENQSSLYDASLLKLNTHNLTMYCCHSMFKGCTNLTQAPELSATILNDYCYVSMFEDCTSLNQAPELPATTLAHDCYGYMFNGCTSLIKAPKLQAAQLTKYCYKYMFSGCASLAQAPELPATTLANSCYYAMFNGCTSITHAPELPATTLADICYSNMFSGCTSLVQAPELPATQLTEYCYDSMFYGCTSLTQAPELPATTLERACYYAMFSGCTKLNYIKCLATDISAEFCTDDWLSNVASVGTFECDNKKYFLLDSSSGIPVGWTIKEINPDIEKPDLDVFNPEIPFCIENVGNVPAEVGLYNNSTATAVRTNCKISYNNSTWSDYALAVTTDKTSTDISKITLQNKGDRVYIKADLTAESNANQYTQLTVLNSSTDVKIRVRGNIASITKGTDNKYKTDYLTVDDSVCYINMFRDCTNLIQAPELPATTMSSLCYYSMFQGCTGLTQAPDLPATKLAYYCYGSMFQDCTNLVKAPKLPATKLSSYCYNQMFQGCTNLVDAPELPAASLTTSCYEFMFYKCSKLKRAPVLPAATLSGTCYKGMFQDCTSLNYIKCLATDISASNCTNNWVAGVSATGDFYAPASIVWTQYVSGMPAGWTRHDA